MTVVYHYDLRGEKIWSAVTRAALCAGRGTAFPLRCARSHILSPHF